MFKALKIDRALRHGDWTDLAAQLSARKLDALVVVAGVPVPEVAELEKKGNIRNLTLTPSQTSPCAWRSRRLHLRSSRPALIRRSGVIIRLVGVYNFAVARADLPETWSMQSSRRFSTIPTR